MPEEPSILASLGFDSGLMAPPPPQVWEAALQTAFDPTASADADTVPEMDDTPAPGAPTHDDDQLVVDEPAHDAAHDHGDQAVHGDTVLVDDVHADDGHAHDGHPDGSDPGHTDIVPHQSDEFDHHDDYAHGHDGYDDAGGHHGL